MIIAKDIPCSHYVNQLYKQNRGPGHIFWIALNRINHFTPTFIRIAFYAHTHLIINQFLVDMQINNSMSQTISLKEFLLDVLLGVSYKNIFI